MREEKDTNADITEGAPAAILNREENLRMET